MNKPETKTMNYSTEITRRIDVKAVIIDGATKKKADALKGTWIRLNETMFAIHEENQLIVIDEANGSIGCACERFTNAPPELATLACEHLVAFKDIESPPQQSIESREYRWLQAYLFEEKWGSLSGYVYPPVSEPEVVAELPPDEDSWKPDEEDTIESAKLDPVHEEKPLDTGVDEGTTEEPKTITRKCSYCGHTESGIDRDEVVSSIEEHRKTCPKNPANKKKAKVPEKPEQTGTKSATVEEPKEKKAKPQSTKERSLFDWIENLVEFGVGQVFGESGDGKTAFCREVAEQAADEGKKVVYWDTEGNMTRRQRAKMADHKNIEYILNRDWEEIRHMLPVTGENDRTGPSIYAKTPKLKKCDLFILDSIGVPVLGIYGDLKQNEKGSALQGMQGLAYRLAAWAEKNEAVVVITNQPVSEMNKTKAQIADRPPFGDKMKYFTKEILKMVTEKRGDYATVCNLITWRTRDDKRGKVIATVTISDNGAEVTPTGWK